MKLTNPTNEELNEAFHVYVAGWSRNINDKNFWAFDLPVPNYSERVDLILPWLEKQKLWNTQGVSAEVCRKTRYITQVMDDKRQYHEDRDESLSKSATIAMLRSHGIEVEFPIE